MGILSQLAGQLGAFGLGQLGDFLQRRRETGQLNKATPVFNQFLEQLAQRGQDFNPETGLLTQGGTMAGELVPDVPRELFGIPSLLSSATSAASQFAQAPFERQQELAKQEAQFNKEIGVSAFGKAGSADLARRLKSGEDVSDEEISNAVRALIETQKEAELPSKKDFERFKTGEKIKVKTTPGAAQIGGGKEPKPTKITNTDMNMAKDIMSKLAPEMFAPTQDFKGNMIMDIKPEFTEVLQNTLNAIATKQNPIDAAKKAVQSFYKKRTQTAVESLTPGQKNRVKVLMKRGISEEQAKETVLRMGKQPEQTGKTPAELESSGFEKIFEGKPTEPSSQPTTAPTKQALTKETSVNDPVAQKIIELKNSGMSNGEIKKAIIEQNRKVSQEKRVNLKKYEDLLK